MKPIVVAGHVCLDIIPSFAPRQWQIEELMVPGKLIDVGRALLSTGGAVSNTGLALHRLGAPVRLIAKMGNDLFADSICSLFEGQGDGLSKGLVRNPDVSTSYTVVLNPPGIDRIFYHCPGANDAFGPEDLSTDSLKGAGIFHFGYPTLMRRMFEQDGAELEQVLRIAKGEGLATSLDMSLPDPSSPAGQAPWLRILERTLPFVDMYVPSIEEVISMLYPGRGFAYDRALLRDASDRILALGSGLALIKLGSNGIYLRTSASPERLEFLRLLGCDLSQWLDKEIIAPIFEVEVAGTTGCGDSAIAGFLMAVSQGLSPEQAVEAAAATGACSAEKPDAVSGIPSWQAMLKRIADGWTKKRVTI